MFKDIFLFLNVFVMWFGILVMFMYDGIIFILVDDYIKSLKIMVKSVFFLFELVCYYLNGNGFFLKKFYI